MSDLAFTRAQRDTLRALSRAVRDETLCVSASIEDITLTLAAISDNWVAQVFALRAYGEPDAMPTEDLVLRQQAAANAAPLSAQALEQRAELWRPRRGYAACQLWAYAQNNSSRRAAGEVSILDTCA